ncbi:hypothetical protein [uncultured Thiothrix sp.]|uniref:hypothetical protein n=1 Tax=uncultured Thiothrix sp. TaxID=223185 RepID=UPI00260360D5|nr:hypothetical protein [uncultured Thiothrix sp.]HMT92283.1 hypothetical protein [Thiolinea sp.]
MISSSTLAPSKAIDLKTVRSLPLTNTPSIEFGKSTKQYLSLPQSNSEENAKQQALNQQVGQVVEQQINQITDTPTEAQPQRPLALNTPQTDPLIELLDFVDETNSDTKLPQRNPLELGKSPSNTASELHGYKPLELNDKLSSLDIQLLTENSSALLINPNQQFLTILQNLLHTNNQKTPLYWIEHNLPANATQVATEGGKPNLAWQESLWF